MKGFMSELEKLFDNISVAIVMQDIIDGQMLINDRAKDVLSRAGMDLTTFRRSISAMREGTHVLEQGTNHISVNCSIIPMRERTLKMCILRDISEQIKTAEREQIYKACLESITDMNLFACDAQGTIILLNNASAQTDNVDKEKVVGRNMYEVFGPNSDTAIRRALATGEPVLDHQSSYNVRGESRYNVGSAYPIKAGGKLIGAFSINRSYEGVRALLSRTLELQKELLQSKNNAHKNGTTYDFNSIIGESEAIVKAKELASRAAATAANILLYGETGTGKELFAQSIHNASVSRDKPFVAINCAAIPETLLESTLFGTVKGAFTGADNMKGLFEQAGEGTLFLDEINSLPLGLQAKLLRVLQERSYMRVGGLKEIEVKCRILSACNRKPDECVENGILRADLYYRLAAVSIEIPPLRERKGDIALLMDSFLKSYSRVYGVCNIEKADGLCSVLECYSWPGNVRELQHIVESALLQLKPGEKLSLSHFPDSFNRALIKSGVSVPSRKDIDEAVIPDEPFDLEEMLKNMRRKAIRQALEKTNGNVSKAAKQLGYNRTTLQYQMEKLNIK